MKFFRNFFVGLIGLLVLRVPAIFACHSGFYDEKLFEKNLLPKGQIAYRYNPSKQVAGVELRAMVDRLDQEVEQKKEKFTDFDVLRKRDFNEEEGLGLLVLKCKEHPFVVKYFKESPEGFSGMGSRGFIADIQFRMNGGLSNHMLGFSRVENVKQIGKEIGLDSELSKKLTIPRKWFVLPKRSQKLELSVERTIAVPDRYCVVADYIDALKK